MGVLLLIKNQFRHQILLKPEIIDQLNVFRKEGELYEDVVNKLMVMHSKYSPITEIFEYVFVTANNSKVFRLTYKEDSCKVEYFSQKKGYVDRIRAWNVEPRSSKREKDLFLNFLEKEDYASILYNLDYEFNYNYEFKIRCINKESR